MPGGGSRNCCIFLVLLNVAILITLLMFSSSAKLTVVQKRECNLQNLYNAFTIADIQNIEQKDATLRNALTNGRKSPPKLMLENYLRISKNKRKATLNESYRLLAKNCSHQSNKCITYIIKLHADDYILDPSNYYAYYKRRRRIYRSKVGSACQAEFLFKINTAKSRFIHLNSNLNLLFSEEFKSEVTYSVFHYRSKTLRCVLKTKLPLTYVRLKRSIKKKQSRGTSLILILTLVIGIPLLVIIMAVIIVIVVQCCCHGSSDELIGEDGFPRSLVENCKRAEPPPEEQGKYLPELFDVSAFHFKGPLVIERPKIFTLEHDLKNSRPTGSNVYERVKFDHDLNIAYDIGEDVEVVVRNYGRGTAVSNVVANQEDEEDEGDEDEDEDEDGTDDKKQKTEKDAAEKLKKCDEKKKEVKTNKTSNDEKKKIKSSSIDLQKTQESRYSSASMQAAPVGTNIRKESKISKKNDKSKSQSGKGGRKTGLKYKKIARKSKPLAKTNSEQGTQEKTASTKRSQQGSRKKSLPVEVQRSVAPRFLQRSIKKPKDNGQESVKTARGMQTRSKSNDIPNPSVTEESSKSQSKSFKKQTKKK